MVTEKKTVQAFLFCFFVFFSLTRVFPAMTMHADLTPGAIK